MGLTQDQFSTRHDGHQITVEARSGAIKDHFRLLVDGAQQDELSALAGNHYLNGQLPGEPPRPFRVRLQMKAAGLLGQAYFLEIDGEERKLGQGFLLT